MTYTFDIKVHTNRSWSAEERVNFRRWVEEKLGGQSPLAFPSKEPLPGWLTVSDATERTGADQEKSE